MVKVSFLQLRNLFLKYATLLHSFNLKIQNPYFSNHELQTLNFNIIILTQVTLSNSLWLEEYKRPSVYN